MNRTSVRGSCQASASLPARVEPPSEATGHGRERVTDVRKPHGDYCGMVVGAAAVLTMENRQQAGRWVYSTPDRRAETRKLRRLRKATKRLVLKAGMKLPRGV